jgi:hypothetical protein
MKKYIYILLSNLLIIFHCQAQTKDQIISYQVTIKDPTSLVQLDHYTESDYAINESPEYYENHILLNKRIPILKGLINKIKEGEIHAYSMDSLNLLRIDQIKAILLIRSDTMQTPYSFPPYELHDTIFTEEINIRNDISHIEYYEIWHYKRNGKLIKKVIAYALIRDVYDPENFSFLGTKPIFIILSSKKYRAAVREYISDKF